MDAFKPQGRNCGGGATTVKLNTVCSDCVDEAVHVLIKEVMKQTNSCGSQWSLPQVDDFDMQVPTKQLLVLIMVF